MRNYGMSMFTCFYCPEKWVIYSDDTNSEDYYLERAKAKLYRYQHTEETHSNNVLDNTQDKMIS